MAPVVIKSKTPVDLSDTKNHIPTFCLIFQGKSILLIKELNLNFGAQIEVRLQICNPKNSYSSTSLDFFIQVKLARMGQICILGLKSGSNQTSNRISELGGPKKIYFDTSFNLPS